MVKKFIKLFLDIGVPILVLIPVLILILGCNSTELEDRCFPMLALVDMGVDGVYFSYEFPEIGIKDDNEPEKLYNNNGAYGHQFSEAKIKCESNLVKIADTNHLKVIILGETFYHNHDKYQDMLKNMQSQENFPRNTYVCVTDDVAKVIDAGNDLSEDIGSYLEQLLEKKQREEGLVLVTIGDLIDENDNESITYAIPYISINKNQIQINSKIFE